MTVGLTLINSGSRPTTATVRATNKGGSSTRDRTKPAVQAGARANATTAATISTVLLTLSEPSSPASATGHTSAGAPVRLLSTKVRFPTPRSGARTAAGAPFPLVVFSQGFNEPAQAYASLQDAWARAGYVVAAPTYPFTDPSSATGVNENDIVNHPADLHYVIATLEQISRNPHSPLYKVLDPNRVAVIGQSDGGDVSLAVAANSCCRDVGVRAAIILSGAELVAFGGSYYTDGSVPLLVTQGSQDTINPPGCSAQLYDQAPQPKYYLNIAGAQHLAPYVSRGTTRSGIARVTVAFLNAYLKHGPSGTSALSSVAKLPPAEKLTSASTAPGPGSTYCPGAP